MSARLDQAFARMKAENRTGLVAFVTGGDPTLARSGEVIRAVDEGGADVIEIGVPFSDPLADGPEIQRSSERALRAGASLRGVLDLVADLRADVRAPLILFSYANPVVRYGVEAFAARATEVGVDGVLLLDLPLEEAQPTRDVLVSHGLAPIFLLSPTTTGERVRKADQLGKGFLYAISRLGVTGVREQVADDARALVERLRQDATLPIALGFGLSRPEHVRNVGRYADAAVVGSALVAQIAKHGDSPALADEVRAFVRWLREGAPA
ncbi:MAG: tryptophan synthase subunit alpha [Acidobacteria bacterium]|nr:tryptophan synthase subunit alpha [Acidobacteriota bacterium]